MGVPCLSTWYFSEGFRWWSCRAPATGFKHVAPVHPQYSQAGCSEAPDWKSSPVWFQFSTEIRANRQQEPSSGAFETSFRKWQWDMWIYYLWIKIKAGVMLWSSRKLAPYCFSCYSAFFKVSSRRFSMSLFFGLLSTFYLSKFYQREGREWHFYLSSNLSGYVLPDKWTHQGAFRNCWSSEWIPHG